MNKCNKILQQIENSVLTYNITGADSKLIHVSRFSRDFEANDSSYNRIKPFVLHVSRNLKNVDKKN